MERQTSSELVKDAFDIDCDILYTKAEKSGYWTASEKFFEENANRQVKDLSAKQVAWLVKIEKGCQE